SYTNTISESTEGVSRITISNFYNFTTNTVKATVDGANLTIEDQTTSENFQVKGDGSISNGALSINFVITDYTGGSAGSSDTCVVYMLLQ
ncbi:MAG: hypothetical protein GY810_14175, partial [Aureispira sp.]|nr:hypothetical protein [Aureispira sp.]